MQLYQPINLSAFICHNKSWSVQQLLTNLLDLSNKLFLCVIYFFLSSSLGAKGAATQQSEASGLQFCLGLQNC